MKSLLQSVPQFAKDHAAQNRKWIKGTEGEIYVRITERIVVIDGYAMRCTCFDLASIHLKEKYRNKGVFTQLVEALHHCGRQILYVETVSDKWFQDSLVERGWHKENMGPNYPIQSYWKKTGDFDKI